MQGMQVRDVCRGAAGGVSVYCICMLARATATVCWADVLIGPIYSHS